MSKISSISDEIKYIQNSNKLMEIIEDDTKIEAAKNKKDPTENSNKENDGFNFKESVDEFERLGFNEHADKIKIDNEDIKNINNGKSIYYRPKTNRLGLDTLTPKLESWIDKKNRMKEKNIKILKQSGQSIDTLTSTLLADTRKTFENELRDSNKSFTKEDIDKHFKELKGIEELGKTTKVVAGGEIINSQLKGNWSEYIEKKK